MLTKVTVLTLFLLDGLAAWGMWVAGWREPLGLLVSLLGLHILAAAGLMWVLIWLFPVEDGEYREKEAGFLRWQARAFLGCLSCNYFDRFLPIFVLAQWYVLFGARLSWGAKVAGRIIDPSLVKMEKDSILGTDGLITAHYQVGDRIRVARVWIGRGATVGLGAQVFPGVSVGAGASVGAAALLLEGVQVPAGETWAGIPARRVREVRTSAMAGEADLERMVAHPGCSLASDPLTGLIAGGRGN